MDLQELRDKVVTTEKLIAGMPIWRLVLYATLALFILIYLAWSFFHKPAPTARVFTAAPPAVKTPKVAGPVVNVPLKIVPKTAVKAKFPEYHGADDPEDEVIDTADIPPSPNGATTITSIDTETGEATTTYESKPAPWFAFQATNIIGGGVEAGTNGTKGVVYYKRDIVRVKDLYLQVKPVEIKAPLDGGKVELTTGAYVEWRF